MTNFNELVDVEQCDGTPLFSAAPVSTHYTNISDDGRVIRVKVHTRFDNSSESKFVRLSSGDGMNLFVDDIWPGSLALSEYLCRNSYLVKGKTVLELGAGAALPSLVAAALQALRVVITDYPATRVIENIRELISDNGFEDNVCAIGHIWGETSNIKDLLHVNSNKKFEVLILAELLWRDTYVYHEELLQSVSSLMAINGVAYVSFCHRPCLAHSEDNDMEFFDLALSKFDLGREKLYEFSTIDSVSGGGDAVTVQIYSLRLSRS